MRTRARSDPKGFFGPWLPFLQLASACLLCLTFYAPWYSTRLVSNDSPALSLCNAAEKFRETKTPDRGLQIVEVGVSAVRQCCAALGVKYSTYSKVGKAATSFWNNVKLGTFDKTDSSAVIWEHLAWSAILFGSALVHIMVPFAVAAYVVSFRGIARFFVFLPVLLLLVGIAILLLCMMYFSLPCSVLNAQYGFFFALLLSSFYVLSDVELDPISLMWMLLLYFIFSRRR